ncbi:MAG: bacteriohemerythrin [Desulfovibrionaceae bacterium]
MSGLRWDDSLRIGVAEIDDQHQRLVAIANELLAAKQAGRRQAVVLDALRRLREYTVHHFRDEERFMDEVGYPGLGEHQREHAEIVRKVKELQRDVYHKQPVQTDDLLALLKTWLIEHILGSDMRLKRFLDDAPGSNEGPEPALEGAES